MKKILMRTLIIGALSAMMSFVSFSSVHAAGYTSDVGIEFVKGPDTSVTPPNPDVPQVVSPTERPSKLPQTGEGSDVGLTALGAVISMGAVAGILIKLKRR